MSKANNILSKNDGIEGQSWNILDQLYVPKYKDENMFMWHATLPKDSFIPLHSHPTQDEFIYLLEGHLEFVCGDRELAAGPNDFVTLPLGIPHSIHNRSGATVRCLFSVSPTRKLYDYFKKIDRVRDHDVLIKLAAEHEVPFV